MIYPDHRLIALRAVDYADSMCEASGGDSAVFDRHDIAVAYIQGGERTLRRVCLAIAESARIGGLTPEQAQKLLLAIETIENTSHDPYDKTTSTTDTGADT